MAEAVFAFILGLAKGFPDSFRLQSRHEWDQSKIRSEGLEGKTVGIVGVRAIGTQVARLARAFQMHDLGIQRSQSRGTYSDGAVDEMLPASDLYTLLERSDFVVLTLPLTKESKHLIDEAALQRMKPTGIDERALETNKIAGAGLDVFSKEPLPPSNELWDMPNVMITPHWAGVVGGCVQARILEGSWAIRAVDSMALS